MQELIRTFGYDDKGDPIMSLRRNTPALTTFQLEKKVPIQFSIRLIDIWKYSEEHNPQFVRYMMGICEKIVYLFDLGKPTNRRLGVIARIVQEGIDDLVNMPPQQLMDKSIGEVSMTIAGESFSKEAIIQIPEG